MPISLRVRIKPQDEEMANVIMEGGVEAVKRLSDWQKPGGKTVKKELVSSKRATSKYEEKLNKHEMRKDKVASYI